MVKYNVGCGKRNFGSDWVHVDGATFDHITHYDIWLQWEKVNSIDLIYSSHLIAYFKPEELQSLLKHWLMVLKSGGVLRLATPDFQKISMMHNNGMVTIGEIVGPVFGRMEMNGREIYHKYVYDYPTLEKLVTEAGFTDFRLYDHRKTEHPNSGDRNDKYDDHSAAHLKGELISLNVEATKC